MKRAIVLSGGGSKGAYQIGVWKALRKLQISYDIVTGTSVGALNAALMVQKDYLRALWLWYNMDFRFVFDDKIDANYQTKEGKTAILKTYTHAVLGGGMQIQKLERTVSKAIHLKKFYHSPIEMGIVTVKIPSLKPVLLKKTQIDPSKLKDYLIASASCFPAFQKKIIDNQAYIDGGLYDNLPINFAIELGATEVIAVDLNEIGIKKRVKYRGIKITYISPRNNTGSFLVFNKEMARRCMRLGYHDTMKIYQKLDGFYYTFKKGQLKKNYDKISNCYFKNAAKFLKQKDKSIFEKLIQISSIQKLLIETNPDKREKFLLNQIEGLGKIFEIDDSQIYQISKYHQLLIHHYQELKENKEIDKEIANNKFKLWFHNQYTIKYLCDLFRQKKIPHKKILHLAFLFPTEFSQALYLYTILS